MRLSEMPDHPIVLQDLKALSEVSIKNSENLQAALENTVIFIPGLSPVAYKGLNHENMYY